VDDLVAVIDPLATEHVRRGGEVGGSLVALLGGMRRAMWAAAHSDAVRFGVPFVSFPRVGGERVKADSYHLVPQIQYHLLYELARWPCPYIRLIQATTRQVTPRFFLTRANAVDEAVDGGACETPSAR
jgi:hypothetical protein